MPVDPAVQKILDKMALLPETHSLSVENARASFLWKLPASLRIDPIGSSRDIVIPGESDLKARVYTPRGVGPFPLLVFYHGSGFVVCNLDTHDAICRNLCSGAGCVVLSVDYRLAPEHKFPAATDDCLRACRWAATQAADLHIDPNRISVGGDSAGGNLAAVTAMRIRDEGGPRLWGQVLIYPVLDYHTPGTASYSENAIGYGLTRKTMEWYWAHYLNTPEEAANPLAAPLKAKSFASLPPALIVTAEYDPLCDEGEIYAERLRVAGVPTEMTRYHGMHHGFIFFPGIIAGADRAIAQVCEWLKQVQSLAR